MTEIDIPAISAALMKAHDFIHKCTLGILEYLNREIPTHEGSDKVHFQVGMPQSQEQLEARTESRRSFFSSLAERQNSIAFVSPYFFSRVQSERTQERESATQSLESGRKLVISKRGSEQYQIRYLVLGPCLSTSEGQDLASSLITLFFDTRQIELKSDGALESITLIEPQQSTDAELEKFLSASSITRRPLYIFHATLEISTDRAIEANHIVETRSIQFRPNTKDQKTVNNNYLGGSTT